MRIGTYVGTLYRLSVMDEAEVAALNAADEVWWGTDHAAGVCLCDSKPTAWEARGYTRWTKFVRREKPLFAQEPRSARPGHFQVAVSNFFGPTEEGFYGYECDGREITTPPSEWDR